MYAVKLEFPEGEQEGVSQGKSLPWGEVWLQLYFLEPHNKTGGHLSVHVESKTVNSILAALVQMCLVIKKGPEWLRNDRVRSPALQSIVDIVL